MANREGMIDVRKVKTSKKKAKGGETVGKGGPFGWGDIDNYNPTGELAISHHDIVEFHARSKAAYEGKSVLHGLSDAMSRMLTREQVSMLQQTLVFNHMIGRLIEEASELPFEEEYNALLNKLVECTKRVLNVRKVRIFGVEYNSLGNPRELWVVAGETGNLGRSVALEEWAGEAMKRQGMTPVVSNKAMQGARYGASYLALDSAADKGYKMRSVASMGINVRDCFGSQQLRTRYVLECYNKCAYGSDPASKKSKLVDFNECDGYVLGCLGRAAGSAFGWAIANLVSRRTSQVCMLRAPHHDIGASPARLHPVTTRHDGLDPCTARLLTPRRAGLPFC